MVCVITEIVTYTSHIQDAYKNVHQLVMTTISPIKDINN